MNPQDVENRIKMLENEVNSLKRSSLSHVPLDPIANSVLQDTIAIPYMTTTPTFTPPKNGWRVVALLSGTYYFYSYINGGWRRVTLT